MGQRLLASLVLLLLTVLGLLFWSIGDETAALSPEPVAGQQMPAEVVEPSSDLQGEGVSGDLLETGASEVRREVEEPEFKVVEQGGVLRGRVVSDVLGTPLAGASVTVGYRLHGEYSNLDLAHSKSSRPVAEVRTGPMGQFEVPVPEDVPLDVEATGQAHATARRSHVFAGDDVVLRLTPAAILEGELKNASDGSPVEGVLVRGWNSKRVEQFRARTGPGGTFYFDDLQAGVITVAISPETLAAPPWKTVELRAGERTRLDLELEAGVRIHGTVSDSKGSRIAGAEIGEGWTFRKAAVSDALGRYELLGFGGPGVYDIHVRAEGFGGDQHSYPYDAMPTEDTRLDFVLEPARSAIGRVVDSEGVPLEGVYAAGVASQFVEGDQRTDWESTFTDPDGRFELSSLETGLGHQLFLRMEGYGTRVYDFPEDEAQQEPVELGEFVLVPGAQVTGTLRTLTEAPIPGYTVKLRGTNSDRMRLRPDSDTTNESWYTRVRESRTDSRGQFHFADVAEGQFEVTASIRGKRGLSASAEILVPEGGRVEDVELILDFGAPIRGVVHKPDGTPAIGVFVSVVAGDQEVRISAVSGAGGGFEILGVSEDMGELGLTTIVSSYNWANPDDRLGAGLPVTARAGDTDVMLTLRDLVVLTGRVEDRVGLPVAHMHVSAFPAGESYRSGLELATALTDEKGTFRMELPEGCEVDLETGTLRREKGSNAYVGGNGEPVRLESVESDARAVVLRLND